VVDTTFIQPGFGKNVNMTINIVFYYPKACRKSKTFYMIIFIFLMVLDIIKK